jgi:subtilisin family serine protease
MAAVKRGLLVAVMLAFASSLSAAAAPTPDGRLVEVIVGLDAPPLALAHPVATARTGGRGLLSMRAASSVAYLRALENAQSHVELRIEQALPASTVRWHYRTVLDGIAVVLPATQIGRLAHVPGVARVYPSYTYTAQADTTPQQIRATALWGEGLATAGTGMKIGIIDDGVDPSHPYFDPAGYTMPAGFPKGDAAYTTAKVIAARSFPAPEVTWKYSATPFDPELSEHATHVAGIAAGNSGVVADTIRGRPRLSGVAPRAYIGNYKVLTVPTPAVGLNGNSPEIVAGIEAAVQDGMDVINLSLGEPEVDPSRDAVAMALDAAAAAGVVPVVAAGNDHDDLGRGSIGSPGTSARAITVGAVTTARSAPADRYVSFSSVGPTAQTLRLKPDVSAPGADVVSSVPGHLGLWASFSGTSMATPHVAGLAALLVERHKSWTPEQVKSALELTGDPVRPTSGSGEVPTTFEGGGRVNGVRANAPLVFARPTAVSFGLVGRGGRATRSVLLTDAGGGAGMWKVSLLRRSGVARIAVPGRVKVPGRLRVKARGATVTPEATGFIVLRRGAAVRRIPFWLSIVAPKLARERPTPLRRPGVYKASTAGRPALVSSYRYPDDPTGLGLPRALAGPERVFRVSLTRAAANLGVAVLSQGAHADVTPRIVRGANENRLAGIPALPLVINPYLDRLYKPEPVSSVQLPARGVYEIVFDSRTRSGAGAFTFRFWVDDTEPPTISTLPAPAGSARFSVRDGGSGVDPSSLAVTVDGTHVPFSFTESTGTLTIPTVRGTHTVVVEAADYQETKNNENVAQILPNTSRASFVVTG